MKGRRLQLDRDPEQIRNFVLSVRMTQAELDELNALVAHTQVDASRLVRRLIHERLLAEETVAA